ncbi:hypothetical protein BH20ACI4_BH20ACI4_22840 [soil metagenome]
MSEKLLPVKIVHDFVERVEPLKIEYMLTGSLAMMLYSVYRMTADVDIVVELKYEDADRIINAFEPDYYVPHGRVRDAIARQFMFNVIHQETAFKIDLVIKKSNEFQQTAFERRQKKDFYGKEISVITLEDLILSKLLWAKKSLSEKQLTDVENLMQENFDLDYTQNWVSKLSLEELFNKCRNAIK